MSGFNPKYLETNVIVTGQTQKFQNAKLLSQFQIQNTAKSANINGSSNCWELSNFTNSGYRFNQLTTSTALTGDLIIERFTNGSIPGVPVMKLTETGTIQRSITDPYGNTVWKAFPTQPWVDQVTTTTVLVAGQKYVADNATQTVFTLPVNATLGDDFTIIGKGLGGWRVSQNAFQSINAGPISSTTGTAGYITSTNWSDCITLTCITDNTQFTVFPVQGYITYN